MSRYRMLAARPMHAAALALSLALTGCVVRLPPSPPAPAYQVSDRIVRTDSGNYQVQLSTRATNCPVPGTPPVVVERLELFSPEGRLIRVTEKRPTPTSPGSYVGGFTIEMPATAPPGAYRVTTSLSVNGTRCGAHQGTLNHRPSSSSRARREDGRALRLPS